MKIIKQLFLFGISFLIAIALCEVFIKATHISSVSSTEFYNDIGRGRRKNLKFLYFNEGFGIGKFNDHRYIGKVKPFKKTENTLRIALLGDSFVESFQIFERDYFGNVAERNLTKIFHNKNIELLNFGRSGFDIADMYAYEKTFVEKFDPDYIIYMIENNDLNPNYRDPLRPKTIINNDSLKISFDFSQKKINNFEKTKFFTQNFCIINMLNNCWKKTKNIPIQKVLLEKIYTWFNPYEEIIETSDKNLNFELNPVTERIVKILNSEKNIIVNRDINKLPEEFIELCIINELQIFNLNNALDSMKFSGTDPYYWKVTRKKGHWNQKAHNIIGNNMTKIILEILDDK